MRYFPKKFVDKENLCDILKFICQIAILGGNNMTLVDIRTGMWCGDNVLTLSFPDNWNVSIYKSMDAEALDETGIERALSEPIGVKQIEGLARGKQSAVIIVDDLSRPTPAHQVIPHILPKLKAAGIKDESIRFVIGGGSHRPITKEEMEKKVGSDVVANYEVHNHDVYSGNLVGMGNLEDGTPIYINDVVANSELKIGVAGMVPHGGGGIGGGGKLVVPGIAGYTTIAYNHGLYKGRGRGNVERQGDEKDMRDNAEEVARHIGLDFMVNIVFTSKREIGGLFAGDVVESHRHGGRFAQKVYNTVIPKDEIEKTDIVVINCYPQDYDPVQMGKSMWPSGVFKDALKVVINPASDGILYHGMGNRMDYKRFLRLKANEPEPMNIPEKAEIKSKDT
ncbi:TPA: DUF2088 domain-containing protein, partial [Candidatus Poribacteria bacterium]|nr:DUF2088 domain-containing protein [Candidatus Poribacteria bacterium]